MISFRDLGGAVISVALWPQSGRAALQGRVRVASTTGPLGPAVLGNRAALRLTGNQQHHR